jgi:hypothetical protein
MFRANQKTTNKRRWKMKNGIDCQKASDLWERNSSGDQVQIRLYIDLENEIIYAGTDWTPGSTPIAEWLGHIKSFVLPSNVNSVALKDWVDETIMPLAIAAHDGYEAEWDGSNNSAKFSEKAIEALYAIDNLVGREDMPTIDGGGIWDAGDWLDGATYYDEEKNTYGIDDTIISHDTTDEELEEIADFFENEAEIEERCIKGTLEYLEGLRDELIKTAEED